MRGINLFTAVASALIAGQVSAQGLSCADVYQNAIRNVTIDTRDRSASSFYFNLYCERDGSVRSGSASAELEFPIADIPLGVSGDGSWDESELREFCSVGAQEGFYEASDISVGSFVVTDALTSFNQCLFLQRASLIVSHQEAPPASFAVFGAFTTPAVRAEILSVSYDPDELACNSTDFSGDGSREVIDGSRVYDPDGQNFAITCTRTRHTYEDRDFYRRTWFQMVTSLGPYTVIVPEDTHLGFELASQAEAAFDFAIAERNRALAERNAASGQVATLQQRIRTLLPVVVLGYVGDSHIHHPNGRPCGTDIESVLASLCPANTRPTGFTRAGTVSGGTCGNSWFTTSCLPLQ